MDRVLGGPDAHALKALEQTLATGRLTAHDRMPLSHLAEEARWRCAGWGGFSYRHPKVLQSIGARARGQTAWPTTADVDTLVHNTHGALRRCHWWQKCGHVRLCAVYAASCFS
jgi:hypothetical protein